VSERQTVSTGLGLPAEMGHCLSIVFRKYSMKETKHEKNEPSSASESYEQNRFRKLEEQETEEQN